MDSPRDRIAVELGGIVGGTTEGTVHGGRFTVDPDTIRQVINNWIELANSYAQSAQDARPMAALRT